MTDQTDTLEASSSDDVESTEDHIYDLALYMRNRCLGFACLLEGAFESRSFDDNEKEGIAQLAIDIAERAIFEIIRTKGLDSDGAKQ